MTPKMDALIRRLLLLGVPLMPACGQSSCPEVAKVESRYAELSKPTGTSDAGTGRLSLASWTRCVETSECLPLCQEHFGHFADVKSCNKVVPDAAPGSDDERIGIQAKVVFICEGRRPLGYQPPPPQDALDELGAWLAEAAWLEAASVDAFMRLSEELARHEAPNELVTRARTAAEDERRHARMMATLAERRGAKVMFPTLQMPADARPLLEIAIENAREGCVRETVGALVAFWQAKHANDLGIRRAMRVIAQDEAAHAELALDVHAWVLSRLDHQSRHHVRQAMQAAKHALLSELNGTPAPHSLCSAAGLPNHSRTKQMLRLTDRMLWSEAA